MKPKDQMDENTDINFRRRCDRNRKRSKRRAIYCPIHGCYLDSISQKYQVFANRSGQLEQRGMSRRNALILLGAQTAVPLKGEWVEAFWCEQCQQTKWYHVVKGDNGTYKIREAPLELWQQLTGVVDNQGNPSVGEYTRRHSRGVGYSNIKDFN